MNPRDYDISELQGMAGGVDPTGPVDADSRGNGSGNEPDRPDDVLRSNQYRELVTLERASTDDLEKPYLDTLPETYVAELVIFEWLEFLLTRVGFRETLDVLGYYRSIGWLSEAAEDRLADYLRRFDDPVEGGGPGRLDRSDHALSLVYVARLQSMA